jgi:hypothetical protein
MRISAAPDMGLRAACQTTELVLPGPCASKFLPLRTDPRSPSRPPARAVLACAALACVGLLARGAGAAELRFDGDYRLRFADNTNLQLDDRPTSLLGQHEWWENRLRLTGKITDRGESGQQGSFEIQMQFDVLDGLFAGDTARTFQGLGWDGRSVKLSTEHTGVAFRSFFVELRLPFGQIQFGQMPSQWGMGMVNNSGNEEDSPDFGDVRFGDISERALFATKPLAPLLGSRGFANDLTLAVGGDLVYSDRYATLIERNGGGLQWGDTAWQGLFAVIWQPEEASKVGFYAVRRVQTFAVDSTNLHLWVFDGYARTTQTFPSLDLALTVEAEGAANNGRTSHATNLNAESSVAIAQQGFAARVRASLPQLELEGEVGYASGDANPFDDASTGFTFNRDYKVGLVLWDEVMLFQSQNAAARLADPTLVGRPPNGIDLLPTEGAVTNALYLKPTVRWRPAFLGGKIRLIGSLLWARAPQPVVDPYQALIYSAPRNAYGAAAGQDYGVELDGAVSYHENLFNKIGLELGAQYGVLFPGDVFDKPDGSRLGKVVAFKLRAGLQF